MVPTLSEQIADQLVRYEKLLHEYSDQEQRARILRHLQSFDDNDLIDIQSLQPPKTIEKSKNKNRKRLLTALELQDRESEKKAKTPFGKKAADEW